MIIATMATYPPRAELTPRVVRAIAPQVDLLVVVLNEYRAVPDHFPNVGNVRYVLPERDLKDVGKFLPDCRAADHVLTVDDDIDYPEDYVARTVARFREVEGHGCIGGYHGSIYTKPVIRWSGRGIRGRIRLWLRPDRIAAYRDILHFCGGLERARFVDQLGTGTTIFRGSDFPPLGFMLGSQKFVDVRVATWCKARGLRLVSLPREEGWLKPFDVTESIFADFTQQHPAEVAREIWAYAFLHPDVGQDVMEKVERR